MSDESQPPIQVTVKPHSITLYLTAAMLIGIAFLIYRSYQTPPPQDPQEMVKDYLTQDSLKKVIAETTKEIRRIDSTRTATHLRDSLINDSILNLQRAQKVSWDEMKKKYDEKLRSAKVKPVNDSDLIDIRQWLK